MTVSNGFRKTTQILMPARRKPTPPGEYNIYPTYPLDQGKIRAGYDALAEKLISLRQSVIILDGYPGVLWENFISALSAALAPHQVRVAWHNIDQALLPPEEIDWRIAPFLGGNDPLFGVRYPGSLKDFFDAHRLSNLKPDPTADVNIIYGTGAALSGWPGHLVYIDVPKNEIQFRARSKSVKNIGAKEPLDPKPAYKRSYFIDWGVANKHKAELLPSIDLMVDEQRPDEPVLMSGETLRDGLKAMARTCFRVRPWFEPGPWGGQWIKEHISQLAQNVPNYAWSFELISPENGLICESGDLMLEVSFDTLMFQAYRSILGQCAENFQYEFPIRFDFLDTFDGGNLSIQCHPRPEYIRKHFGESFTQDETYYILDSAPGSRVYLGFQEDADPCEFKDKLLESAKKNSRVDIDHYVYSRPVKKHDLILIPNGTVHGSGKNNLVLEISATPYIFTFKMYDWLRSDLDGKPRSLNIERAFDNLYTDRKGKTIEAEFVSKPSVLAQGEGWRVVHCPTHPNHFYDIQRYEFCGSIEGHTGGEQEGSCHVLSLVEGQAVFLETENGFRQQFNYAETFVIPAAAGAYRLSSQNGEWVKVIKAFMKPSTQWVPGVVPNEEKNFRQ